MHEPPSQHFSELIGSPDWVLEVVSPSSKKVDAIDLKDRYFEAGVPEYGLVDAIADEIDFSVFIPGNQCYKHASQQDDWRFSPVFDRWFKLTRARDQVGLWQYTLAMRE
jgi:Uma2 family endonuclease